MYPYFIIAASDHVSQNKNLEKGQQQPSGSANSTVGLNYLGGLAASAICLDLTFWDDFNVYLPTKRQNNALFGPGAFGEEEWRHVQVLSRFWQGNMNFAGGCS